jgi:hypothetical protein
MWCGWLLRNICVTDNHRYVTLSLCHRWPMICYFVIVSQMTTDMLLCRCVTDDHRYVTLSLCHRWPQICYFVIVSQMTTDMLLCHCVPFSIVSFLCSVLLIHCLCHSSVLHPFSTSNQHYGIFKHFISSNNMNSTISEGARPVTVKW